MMDIYKMTKVRSGKMVLMHSRILALLVGIATVVGMLGIASAAVAAPVWQVDAVANSSVAPGGTLRYVAYSRNIGDIETDGTSYSLSVELPAGFTIASMTPLFLPPFAFGWPWDCSSVVPGASSASCSATELVPAMPPTDPLQPRMTGLVVDIDVDPGASTGAKTVRFTVAGGGAADAASVDDATQVTFAAPEFGVAAFDLQVRQLDDGLTDLEAGGHPSELTTAIEFNTRTHPTEGVGWPVEPVKNVTVDLPPGLVGDPTSLAQCTVEQLIAPDGSLCREGSQVGTVRVYASQGARFNLPVFNMVPPPDAPARFGFYLSGTVVALDAALRTGSDYGLTVVSRNVPEALSVNRVETTFWGFPADSSHNAERHCAGTNNFGCGTEAEVKPFFRAPTSCVAAGDLTASVHASSWVQPNVVKSATTSFHEPPGFPTAPDEWGPPIGIIGCEAVPFDPTFVAQPAAPAQANTPSAFSFDLSIPQTDLPDALAPSDLRKAVVTLPEGVRVSPPSAHGLEGCASGQIKLGSDAEPSCPDGSKVGSVTIDTPLLEEPLTGSVYLAKPFDNPSNSLIAMYVVVHGPGIIIKLDGSVAADPVTGQLTATFDDNPQLPFESLHLEFFDGDRAPLVLPRRCGTYTTHAVLTGWSGKVVESDSSFTIDRDSKGNPCPAGDRFAPDFKAWTVNPVAGVHTPFVLTILRDDEDEELRGLSVKMPQGMLARINGVPRCAAANAALGTCSERSRVGTVTTGAGAGALPFFLTGNAYLGGPYKGAPFSLVIAVPAKAGPFDLGTVVVRSALHIDRRTAQVKVVADPLPTILQGIPLQVREIRVVIDRERFFLNPTSCKEKQIRGTLTSVEGSVARVRSRFQVGECGRLGLRPRISFRVGGKGKTREGGSTSLTTTLRQSRGQTGLRSVAVQLPLVLNGRLDVIQDACSEAEFAANAAKNCANARTGVAVARTPLLERPLRGSAYFVDHGGKGLPNLVIALRGEVAVDLVGKVVIPRSNKLGTRFAAVPDVPITSFRLKLFAGRNGSIGTTANLCSRKAQRARVSVRFVGQNGKRLNLAKRLNITGCGKAKPKHRR
jgi:hypothetical protein